MCPFWTYVCLALRARLSHDIGSIDRQSDRQTDGCDIRLHSHLFTCSSFLSELLSLRGRHGYDTRRYLYGIKQPKSAVKEQQDGEESHEITLWTRRQTNETVHPNQLQWALFCHQHSDQTEPVLTPEHSGIALWVFLMMVIVKGVEMVARICVY